MASSESSNTGKNMNLASDTNHSGSKNNEKKRSSSIDDGNIVVERQRIDCKCSKSECKDKRCLCYRFGVGCSLRCGCTSCKNTYGIKESSSVAKEQEHANDQERDNNDGNRGCKCKKTKCLQLYCECFKAGKYCKDSCSCENCLNRPENKDSVNEAKKKIELRNPRAFEPKITVVDKVKRRSKGCDCEKIKCMGNNCGCFRYKVGCSLQCRCANCRNPHGTKDSSSVAKEQERANNNDNNGSNNEGTTVNGSSPESHHPVVDDNGLTQVGHA
ncbi:protein tesmin/TSO1-like CXC 2 [Arachis ipaensis]|uniref:protein tesmin/TSO1-like CXC 2 n=1 Tax=Arachis ipaensis TaxID=130454 RepID=UPI000A2B50DC|nr:protein tesmin/TSO1-like CXC 2 [Arachis ipaensis]